MIKWIDLSAPRRDRATLRISDATTTRRRHWQIASVATVGVLAVGAITVASNRRDERTCPSTDVLLRGIWDDQARSAVQRRYNAVESSYAEVGWTYTSRTLDDYADTWSIAYSMTCEQLIGAPPDAPDPELLIRGACLRWRLQQLDSAVQILRNSDAEVLAHAVPVLGTLESIAACENPERARLESRGPSDPQRAQTAQEVRVELARADAANAASQFNDALALSQGAVKAARKLEDTAVLAEALVRLGRAQHKLDSDHGEPVLREAINAAVAADHLRAAAAAWLALAQILTGAQDRFGEAVAVMTSAQTALLQSGGDPRHRAQLLGYWAGLETRRSDFDAAEEKFQQAAELLDGTEHEDGPIHGSILSKWSGLEIQRARYEAALPLAQRARAIMERTFGPGHPATVSVIVQLAAARRSAAPR